MRIKLWKKEPPSQEYIEKLSVPVEKWQKINAMMGTPGWRLVDDAMRRILSHKSDIRNSSDQSEEYRKGYCDGLSQQALHIKSYQRAAERAGEKLSKVAQQMKG